MDPLSRGSEPKNDLTEDGLLDQRPVRLYDVEERTGVDNCIRIVIPRFRDTPFGRFFTRIAVQTEDKLNLDQFGSFVYMSCDGTKSVKEIGAALKTRFGGSVEPAEDRLAVFVKDLFRRNLISFVRDA